MSKAATTQATASSAALSTLPYEARDLWLLGVLAVGLGCFGLPFVRQIASGAIVAMPTGWQAHLTSQLGAVGVGLALLAHVAHLLVPDGPMLAAKNASAKHTRTKKNADHLDSGWVAVRAFALGIAVLGLGLFVWWATISTGSATLQLDTQVILPGVWGALGCVLVALLWTLGTPLLYSKYGRRMLGQLGFYTLVVVIFIYLMFPFYWALVSALKTEAELIQTPATLFPQTISLQNFRAVLSNPRFLKAIRNSTIVASCATLISLVVGAFAGFAMGKMRFRGRTVSLYAILAMTMFPQVAVLAGLYAVMSVLNMPTTISLILSYLMFTLPFTVWVLTSFFKGLPQSLLQAAQIDGASMMQSLWHVLLPLTTPALVTTGLLTFINAWNEYLFSLTLTATNPEAQTIPVAVANLSGKIARQEPTGEIMAGALIVTVPLVLLVLIFQKRIISGLTAGAVKG